MPAPRLKQASFSVTLVDRRLHVSRDFVMSAATSTTPDNKEPRRLAVRITSGPNAGDTTSPSHPSVWTTCPGDDSSRR